ncbi:MAG: DEAD/DEAH box helicase [Limimaricola sp.]|uniref:DEAD/DEAH box helicase n=1 Tax=Limimaricola sp. TaxID=2211665 RepID=UPI001E16F69C|nr:DEAD/DEAH box helicase [Limimaricola sp.]MBI1418278.1 DEAD/DEAH box helicase [Limimaricola sp.]
MIPTLAAALAERGYDQLTPVQEAVTDPALGDADLLVSAQTGSGKTVGFGLAIAPTLLGNDTVFGPATAPLALVVAPTRELAMQVKRELAWLYAQTGAVLASTVGGMDMRDERRTLERGAHIVVATPGRLRDHIMRNTLDMSAIRAVVLDEADEMLDLGFREDLEFILAAAPESRRTLMFSATVPAAIARLAESYQKDAQRISTVAERSQHADIAYRALNVAPQDAENALINVLRFHEAPNAIVFANTRAAVTRLTTRLSNRGFQVVALSGELSQTERSHALQAMRDGRARVCVATDVAARGIDLPNLDLVIHADLPSNSEVLLHRSGRTGRAGRKGVSALIVPPKMRRKAEMLLKGARVTAEWAAPPSADEVLRRDEERLLTDPVWTDDFTEAETGFAARLLELYSPDVIAAAYLRLHAGRHSAPEDLADPGAPPPPRPTFGPSRWFRLNAGKNDRVEARWLLPLLCKAGDVSKDAIGAIRIRAGETFVEISEAQASGFLAALGPEMKLEGGAVLSPLDTPPDLGPQRAPKPHRKTPQAEAAPPPSLAPEEPAILPPAAAPVVPAQADEPAEAPHKPRHAKPPRAASTPAWDGPKDAADAPANRPRNDTTRKPRAGSFSKDDAKRGGPKSAGFKSHGKPKGADSAGKGRAEGFKSHGKPKGAESGRPQDPTRGGAVSAYGRGDARPARDNGDKPAGKPYTKHAPKTAPNAADTSRRFTPPGQKPGQKPGPKPARHGGPRITKSGDQPPRRPGGPKNR